VRVGPLQVANDTKRNYRTVSAHKTRQDAESAAGHSGQGGQAVFQS